MPEYIRKSPVEMPLTPASRERKNGWDVVLAYEGQGEGPWLVDLSHLTKYDVQDRDLARLSPWGRAIPAQPGQTLWEEGLVINRQNRTQASVWLLGPEELPPPADPAFTETTDGLCLLALTGRGVLALTERLTRLDLAAPGLAWPRVLQGPAAHVPCQVVPLAREGDTATVLLAFSRGYGRTLTEAVLATGAGLGLTPGGWEVLPFAA
ncbi:MAG: sarcosine oxidase subunit gamma SoxG [Deltaproteobacteria bacterium]|nr:sarcosine oxidase subunit gamma SoxG [Deltaproteobacteria bacterium]